MRTLILLVTGLTAIPVYAATIDVTAAPYGAIAGDGICDADEIQAAIAAAAPGDTVYIPSGTFNINKHVVLTGDIYLKGAGDGNTSNDTLLLGPAVSFDGQSEIQSHEFKGIEDLRFKNIEVEVKGAAMAAQNPRYIKNCTFLLDDWDVVRSLYLESHDVTTYGNVVRNLTIEGCTFDHLRNSIEGGLADSVIKNNLFISCFWGMKLHHLENVAITDNVIMTDGVANLGNEAKAGIKIMPDGKFTPIFRGNTISGNAVDGVRDEGISMEARPNGASAGNALFKIQGIVNGVNSNELTLSSMKDLDGNDITEDVLDCAGYSLIINDNKFYGGLVLDIASGSVSAKTVVLKTPLPCNIDDLAGSSYILGGVFYLNKISHNVVSNCGRSGIDLYGPAVENEITSNSVLNCNTDDPGSSLRGGIILKNFVMKPNAEKWTLPVMKNAVLNNKITNAFLKLVNIGTVGSIPVSPSGNIMVGNLVVDEDLPGQSYDFTTIIDPQEFTPQERHHHGLCRQRHSFGRTDGGYADWLSDRHRPIPTVRRPWLLGSFRLI